MMGEFTLTQSVAFIPGLSHFKGHFFSIMHVKNNDLNNVVLL